MSEGAGERGNEYFSSRNAMAVSGAQVKSSWPKVEGPGEQLRCTCTVVWLRNGRSKLSDGCSGFFWPGGGLFGFLRCFRKLTGLFKNFRNRV